MLNANWKNIVSNSKSDKKSGEQLELFKAETTWFHIFNAMIRSGDLAKISGSAVKVYLAIKSHTNFATGRSFPSIELIGEETGLSESQTGRCLNELVKLGYVTKEKKGRRNHYMLREKIPINNNDGRPEAIASWDYLPSTVRDAVAELKHFSSTGEGGQIINIERLTINIAKDNAQQINLSAADVKELPKGLKEQLDRIINKNKTA